MGIVIGAVTLLAGVAMGLFLGSLGAVAKRADDAAEAAFLRVEDQKRAWHSGYLAGWDDKAEGRPIRSIIESPTFVTAEDLS